MSKYTVTIASIADLVSSGYMGEIGARNYTPTERPTGRTVEVNELSFSSAIFGGYWAAAFDIPAGNLLGINEMTGMLGCEVRIYNAVGQQVWEGFIDSAAISNAVTTITVGPLMDVSNNVVIQYRNYTFNVTPPVYNGDKTYPESGWATLDESIEKWGEMYEILAAQREMSDTEAERVAGYILSERGRPSMSVDVGNGEATPWSLHVECLGYFHLLKKRYVDYYSNDLLSADEVVSQAMSTVGLFVLDQQVDHIGLTMNLWNDEIETAYDFVDATMQTINTNYFYGFSLGVYNDRVVRLRNNQPKGDYASERGSGVTLAPTHPNFFISAATGKVMDAGMSAIELIPMPGDWLAVVDADPLNALMSSDVFIAESVEVSNESLVINRMKFSMLERFLNQKGV